MNQLLMKIVLPKKSERSEPEIFRLDHFPSSLSQLCSQIHSKHPELASVRYILKQELPNGTIKAIASEAGYNELRSSKNGIKLKLEIVDSQAESSNQIFQKSLATMRPSNEDKNTLKITDTDLAQKQGNENQALKLDLNLDNDKKEQAPTSTREIIFESKRPLDASNNDTNEFVRIKKLSSDSPQMIKTKFDENIKEIPSFNQVKEELEELNLSRDSALSRNYVFKKDTEIKNYWTNEPSSDFFKFVEDRLKDMRNEMQTEYESKLNSRISEVKKDLIEQVGISISHAEQSNLATTNSNLQKGFKTLKDQLNTEIKTQINLEVKNLAPITQEHIQLTKNNVQERLEAANKRLESADKRLEVVDKRLEAVEKRLESAENVSNSSIKLILETEARIMNKDNENSKNIANLVENVGDVKKFETSVLERLNKFESQLESQEKTVRDFIERQTREAELNNANFVTQDKQLRLKLENALQKVSELGKKLQQLETDFSDKLDEAKQEYHVQVDKMSGKIDTQVNSIKAEHKKRIEETERELKFVKQELQSIEGKVTGLGFGVNYVSKPAKQHESDLKEQDAVSGKRITHALDIPLTKPETKKKTFRIVSIEEEKNEPIKFSKSNSLELVIKSPASDELDSGSEYEMQFTVKNSGEKQWSDPISLVCTDGYYKDQAIKIDSVENSITHLLVAPCEPGNYITTWRLQDNKKEFFGPIASFRFRVKLSKSPRNALTSTFINCHTAEQIENAIGMRETLSGDLREYLEFARENDNIHSKEELIQNYLKKMEDLQNIESQNNL